MVFRTISLQPHPQPLPTLGRGGCIRSFVCFYEIFRDIKYTDNGKMLRSGICSPPQGGEDACALPYVIM